MYASLLTEYNVSRRLLGRLCKCILIYIGYRYFKNMTCIGNQRRLYTYDKIQIKDKCSKLKTQYATD